MHLRQEPFTVDVYRVWIVILNSFCQARPCAPKVYNFVLSCNPVMYNFQRSLLSNSAFHGGAAVGESYKMCFLSMCIIQDSSEHPYFHKHSGCGSRHHIEFLALSSIKDLVVCILFYLNQRYAQSRCCEQSNRMLMKLYYRNLKTLSSFRCGCCFRCLIFVFRDCSVIRLTWRYDSRMDHL